MVNFKPGEYMRKMFYSVYGTDESEKKSVLCTARIFFLGRLRH